MILTAQQAKVFNMLREGDCFVDTGRRWGKTVLAQNIAINWALGEKDKDPVEVIVVEPTRKSVAIFIEEFRKNFSNYIENINRDREIITLKNKYRIHLHVIDKDWYGDLFRGNKAVVVDEYCYSFKDSLKRFLSCIPKGCVKCFLGTPADNVDVYLIRKWMFRSDSFHFYRFPTPEECIPENIRDCLPPDQVSSEVYAEIPADPTSEYVKNLRYNLDDLSGQLKSIQYVLSICESALENIEKYTLD